MRWGYVLEYHLVSYRRAWRGSVFISFVMPIMYLAVLGAGVGSYIRRDIEGVSYLAFLAPGLLAVVAFQVAAEEAVLPVYSLLSWKRVYHAMAATPAAITDILAGQVAFIGLRAGFSGSVFALVMLAFGVVSGWTAWLLPATAVLIGLATAAPLVAFTTWQRSSTNLVLVFRLVVVPLAMLSGVFFPVGLLPDPIRWVLWATPLWHGVELCRGFATGFVAGASSGLDLVIHAAVLAAFTAIGFAVGHAGLRRTLTG